MTQKESLFSIPLSLQGELAPRLQREGQDDDECEALGAILSEVRRFCGQHVDGAAIDQRGFLGRELLDGVGEMGWFGLTIPDTHGGAGLSMKAATGVVAELTSCNGSLGTCVGLHSGLGLYSLLHLAAPALRERYLPEIAEGKRIVAFAATEPNAGSDIASMRALLREQDGKLILSGSKCYVTNGGLCGLVTVVARSPGLGGARAGHTMVAVDPSWPGVLRQREEKKLGLKGSSTITIDFEDVEIPADHVIGEMSKGLDQAHLALQWGRTFMAAGCLGATRAALHEMRTHTADRVQFGRPIAKFPLVRERTAQMMADLLVAESVVRMACDLFELRRDIGQESAVAKVLASEVAWDVIDGSLQMMGGTGFIEEAGMARRLRDVRVTRIFEGANDVLRMHLASATLGWTPAMLQEQPKLASLVGERVAKHAERADALFARLSAKLMEIRKRLGIKLFEQQVLQAHMADAIIALYGVQAVLIRENAAAAQGRDREAAIAELALGRWLDRLEQHVCALERGQQGAPAQLLSTVLD